MSLISRAIANRLRTVFGPQLAAAKIQILQEEEWDICETPVVFMDGELEKATAGAPTSTLRQEIEFCLAKRVRHDAVVRYTFCDCFVHRAGFEAGGSAHRVGKFDYADAVAVPEKKEAATYCMTSVVRKYFGHWLLDGCATALLSGQGSEVFLDERPDWPHTSEYLAAFGCKVLPSGVYRVGELAFIQDHSQGSLKRARYREMRRRAREEFNQDMRGPKAVFLRRGRTGVARFLDNEDEVLAWTARAGFHVVDLAAASAREIFNLVKDAQIVVSVEGSHLNHLYMAMEERTGILTIIPSDRFTMTQLGYARAIGVRYGFVVANKTSIDGYTVSPEIILRTVDKMRI